MKNKVQLTTLGILLGYLVGEIYRQVHYGPLDGILFPCSLALVTTVLLVFNFIDQ
jgi:hypothetical protein